MKRSIAVVSILLLVCSIAVSPSYAQDASAVLNKLIDASGGRKALEAIKDTTMIGDMELVQMGMSLSFSMYHKEPNMTRQDMEVMGMAMTQAFDGEIAWMINPQTGAVEEQPGMMTEYAKRSALEMGNDALLHPEKHGITYKLKGKESLEGNDYFVVEQIFESGDINTMFIDAKTYLMHKTKGKSMDMMGGEVEQDMVFSDYKKVDGIMMAHSMTILQGGEEFGTMTLTEVKFNSGLEDAFFKMEK